MQPYKDERGEKASNGNADLFGDVVGDDLLRLEQLCRATHENQVQ